MAGFLQTDIKYLKGIGEARAKTLASELDITTFGDLLEYYPARYTDRSRFYSISEFAGEMPSVQLKGHFINFTTEGEGRNRRLRATFTDGHRLMEVIWFSKIDTIARMYAPGKEYVIFGKPTLYRSTWSMAHPEIDAYDPDRPPTGLQGVYPLTDNMRRRGFTQRVLRTAFENLLANPALDTLPESLPQKVVDKYGYPGRVESYRALHAPTDPATLRRARERMKFEELFYLELQILRFARTRSHTLKGYVFPHIGSYFNRYYSECIPFELTGAQKRVLKEIRADMKTGRQMNRLLQGDVGSGKTMVAFMSMLMAADNGFQAALMAPTEILASQHYETLRGWSASVGLDVALLTGSTRAPERRRIHAGLLSGEIHFIVGTHALLEEKVEFRKLGLAVIDEQHRFGVAQRARMWGKGATPPHVLVMTATPIPRTLAMTVYGDLEVSVIDELPPGRKPIETWLRTNAHRGEVYRHMLRQLREGRQAYVVHPLIDDNEKLDLLSLEVGLQRIQDTFPEYRTAWVHGRMKPDEKERQMQSFVSGEARILVATTVIEVGVNVPNASVMIIENAERFGLSQLHQLRGRVGRGAERSWCILMTKDRIAAQTRRRLEIMTRTTDGFLVSEADMKLRGPGDMEGTQQSGIAFNLRLANLATDGQLVAAARETAEEVIAGNQVITGGSPDARPEGGIPLDIPSLQILADELRRRFGRKTDWSLIS